MKSLKNKIFEASIEDIKTNNLEEWINNDKPVETKDKREVIIKKIEISEYPNKIIGCVKMKDSLFDYEWNLKGECIKALDELGKERKPEEKDYLYKKLSENLNESKNTLFRYNSSMNSERNIINVIDFEVNELDNNDIINYCLKNYNLSDKLKKEIKQGKTDKSLIKELISEISKQKNKNLKYCIWLASKEAVKELYWGDENQDEIEEYDIKDGILLSDLDYDGKLFGFEYNPKPINL